MRMHLTVGKKIFGGFVLVLILLALMALRSHTALSDSTEGFDRYRSLARTSAQAARLQAQWLKLRNSVKDFIITGREDVLEDYAALETAMLETLDKAASTMHAPERKASIDSAAERFDTYRDGFARVVESRRERDRIIEEILDYEGGTLEQNLSMILVMSRRHEALTEAYFAAEATRSLLLGQLFATKYLQTNSEDDLIRTRQEFEDLLDIFSTLDEKVENSQRRLWLEQAQEAARNYLKGFESIVAVITERNETIASVLDTVGPAMAADIDAVAQSVLAEQDRLGPALQAENGKAVRLVLIIGMASVALGMVAAILITRGLTVPLKRTTRAAEEVASGNMDVTLSPRGSDEIADLQRALARMLETIRANIDEVRERQHEAEAAMTEAREATAAAEEARAQAEGAKCEGMLSAASHLEDVVARISTAVEQISARTDEVSGGAERQRARVGETATAMEEMNATVLEVARSAGNAAEHSDTTRGMAEDGADIVRRAVAANQQVHSRTDELKSNMDALSQHTASIGQIMTMITDIADQTNLLALNAAIEAARAGDAGRGFAVVADEVRKLAEKTMGATKDVEQAVQAIQNASQENVRRMDEAAEAVNEAMALAEESGGALERIVALAVDASDQVRSIATASEQQSATSEEIARSIEDVSAIADETAEGMGQTSRAMDDLVAQAGELQRMIAQMREENS